MKLLSSLARACAVALILLFLSSGQEAEAQSSPEEVEAIIRATWPDHEEETALAIAYRESGLDPLAYNPTSGAFCPFQILPSTADAIGADHASLADPVYCSLTAARLQDLMGWSPWALTYY
jgi:hypothetical protein